MYVTHTKVLVFLQEFGWYHGYFTFVPYFGNEGFFVYWGTIFKMKGEVFYERPA